MLKTSRCARLDYSKLHKSGERCLHSPHFIAPQNSFTDQLLTASTMTLTSLPDPQSTSQGDAQQSARDHVAEPPNQDALATWAREHHLTKDTMAVLHSNGCDNIAIVLALTKEDVLSLGLNLGQRRMLLNAIGHNTAEQPTQPAYQPAAAQPAPQTCSGGAMAAPLSLADLLDTSGAAAADNIARGPGLQDPELFLHLAAGKGDTTYLDIVDFVPGDILKNSEHVLSVSDDLELIARSGSTRQNKLLSVTPTQWSAANSAIMARLINDGLLGPRGVQQYLNYSYKIGDLGRSYTWSSILLYDREYRQLQARLNFDWGSDISHLRATTLIPKQQQSHVQTNKRGFGRQGQASVGRSTAGQLILCRDFNKGSCFRSPCRFLHRCSVSNCFGTHSAAQHTTASAAKN